MPAEMSILQLAVYYLLYLWNFWSIIRWKWWRRAPHTRLISQESPSITICFQFLSKTSRSFSTIIQELHPELRLPICIAYLVLRGLDTIEDDISIPLDKKEPLLRSFNEKLNESGWSFNGNRVEEKDRDLLVGFHHVVHGYQELRPAYQEIIRDITDRMGNGMADYCVQSAAGGPAIKTLPEFDLYCHHVAGLAGEGITRTFVACGFAPPGLLALPQLYESMGLLLQKTNIILDVKEDHDDGRTFWPWEIWSQHVLEWEDLFEPKHQAAGVNCSSAMVLNTLSHVEQCLIYLTGLEEKSAFNFAAIPQCVAIATLDLCFRNPSVFRKKVKIHPGYICWILLQSTQGFPGVCNVFERHLKDIRAKNRKEDPSFEQVDRVCVRLERFIASDCHASRFQENTCLKSGR